jgi:glycosyltransferase involved in cell wall biosynthesis
MQKVDYMQDARIAWLFPSLEFGAYWRPILAEFTRVFQHTDIYTGCTWRGLVSETANELAIQIVGETTFVSREAKEKAGYSRGFINASPKIVGYLLKKKPKVIFTSAFSIWTLLAVLLKPLLGAKIVILYDGSSPTIDALDSKPRTLIRKLITCFTDAFVTNNQPARHYLIEHLKVNEQKVFQITYLVPDSKTLQVNSEQLHTLQANQTRPVFLFVGQIVYRKGIKSLLDACAILNSKGYSNYTLLIAGSGPQQEEFEQLAQEYCLQDVVKWLGWIDYQQIGGYLQSADVFVFPTFEDIWGMVVLEAMLFGKPILCSKDAGAAELVIDGENGYSFNPHSPQELAALMRCFVDQPELIHKMSEKSKQLMPQYTPEKAANSFAEVTLELLR